MHPLLKAGRDCVKNICQENIHAVLKENIIDKLQHDYDFIFLDSGPHLDAFLKTALGRQT